MDQTPIERKPGIAGREMGVGVPVSIGTAMAIESVLGLLPDHNGKDAEIHRYKSVWINLRTLFRNLLGAMENESRKIVLPEDVGMAMQAEMTTIQSAIGDVTKGMAQVVFYVCTHASVGRRFPHAKHRNQNDGTDNQKLNFIVEQGAIRHILDSGVPLDVRKFDLEFGDNSDALLLTHQPVDLLNRYKFGRVALLESHTGAIKPPSRWYTKLQNGRDLVGVPFDRMTLQLFGDGTMFSPMNIAARKQIVELSKKGGWTYLTTRDMVIKTVRDSRDPLFEALITKLY